MSGKHKGNALPSFLSNIRNAGRASTATHQSGSSNIPRSGSFPEMRSLMMEYETAPNHNHNNNNIITNVHNKHSASVSSRISRLMEKGPMMLERQRDKFRKRKRMRFGTRGSNGQGFAVELPPRVLVYTIIIFFVLPLLTGCFFLIRTVLFGSLREDELHPLHKKIPQPRVRHHGSTSVSASASAMDGNANANVDGNAAMDLPDGQDGASGGSNLVGGGAEVDQGLGVSSIGTKSAGSLTETEQGNGEQASLITDTIAAAMGSSKNGTIMAAIHNDTTSTARDILGYSVTGTVDHMDMVNHTTGAVLQDAMGGEITNAEDVNVNVVTNGKTSAASNSDN